MCDTMCKYNEYLRKIEVPNRDYISDMMPEYRRWKNLKPHQPLIVYFMQAEFKGKSDRLYNKNDVLSTANDAWKLGEEGCFKMGYNLDSPPNICVELRGTYSLLQFIWKFMLVMWWCNLITLI